MVDLGKRLWQDRVVKVNGRVAYRRIDFAGFAYVNNRAKGVRKLYRKRGDE